MIASKAEFIKSFMPETVVAVECAQINLDITDLTLGDILRNLNKVYPQNSRSRNAIISGSMVAAVLCKTESIEPMNGLFVILTNDTLDFQLVSKNYIILCVAESNITSDNDIVDVIDRITKYILKNFKGTLNDLSGFYTRFIYDPTEMENQEDGITLPKSVEFEDES